MNSRRRVNSNVCPPITQIPQIYQLSQVKILI